MKKTIKLSADERIQYKQSTEARQELFNKLIMSGTNIDDYHPKRFERYEKIFCKYGTPLSDIKEMCEKQNDWQLMIMATSYIRTGLSILKISGDSSLIQFADTLDKETEGMAAIVDYTNMQVKRQSGEKFFKSNN